MNMKTKKRSYFLSAILMGIAMLLTACADNDLASQTPLGDKIAGTWQAQYDATAPSRTSPTPAWCRYATSIPTAQATGTSSS